MTTQIHGTKLIFFCVSVYRHALWISLLLALALKVDEIAKKRYMLFSRQRSEDDPRTMRVHLKTS